MTMQGIDISSWQAGDNLSTIAQRLGTTVNALVSRNGIANQNLIYPGQVLKY